MRLLFFNPQSFIAQTPNTDLLIIWYATEVIVDGVSYIPCEYGHLPDIYITEFKMEYFISLTTPESVGCEGKIEKFEESPDGFFIKQYEWVCLLLQHCNGDPEGPYVIMFGHLASIYFNSNTLFRYEITQANERNFALQINNTEGNARSYSNLLLTTEPFTTSKISVR